MKTLKSFVYILATFVGLSCESQYDKMYKADTEEHLVIIKELLDELPEVPVNFYWRDNSNVPDSEKTPVTSCAKSEIRFEKPYIVANGIRFHAHDWAGMETHIDSKVDSRKIALARISFYPKK